MSVYTQSSLVPGDGPSPSGGPVECLGMTFPSDDARRAYFLGLLRERLQDLAFRQAPGFPSGSDEDILALSDPPYYTACPNPFLGEMMAHWEATRPPTTDLRPPTTNDPQSSISNPQSLISAPSAPYRREPLAIDVSEGKTDPIYAAHSYHTKVPYKAIVPAILHYTDPGDVVLDGFSGSGMTGVAVQMCRQPDAELKLKLEQAAKDRGKPLPRWGARRVVLNDLSPAATFISANYNMPFDVAAFEVRARGMLRDLERELGWMYETRHTDGQTARINYTVWSEVFTCPNCLAEIEFLSEALDPDTKRVRGNFPCPRCGVELSKDNLQRVFDTTIDSVTARPWSRITLRPALINYRVGKTNYEKKPDFSDMTTLDRVAMLPLPRSVPTNEFPIDKMYHGSRLAPKGFTRIHHLYLPRAAQALGILWNRAVAEPDPRLRHMLLFMVEQTVAGMSVLNRYGPTHFSQVNRMLTGVYYVASQHSEVSPWYILDGKLNRLVSTFSTPIARLGDALVETGTAAKLGLPEQSIDYIFTDPPFGENIYYADLNFLVESWHRVWTNATEEAIVDRAKGKGMVEYQRLMQRCFEEYYRVLKPGRWMTVVFHNSRNSVWRAIQEALQAAGFIIADVRTLDKVQHSYRQVTSDTLKQDLVISAYKPNGGLEERFEQEKGSDVGVWDFVGSHLRQLPVFVTGRAGQAEIIGERLNFVLFDRMVAFHVLRGSPVPMSVAEFFAGLARLFPERDGMIFLPEQVAEYERRRMTVREFQQLRIAVLDETSAIQWLRQQLTNKPQTTAELTPSFFRELKAWPSHEATPELTHLLDENCLQYRGDGPIPAQIVAWLKKSADLRALMAEEGVEGEDGGLTTQNETLRARARDRWYVPDPNKAIDLEKVRLKGLLREFGQYLESKGKLKQFRTEAVKAGFAQAWQDRDFRTILQVAERLPESVLQEDPDLLMYYDAASLRA